MIKIITLSIILLFGVEISFAQTQDQPSPGKGYEVYKKIEDHASQMNRAKQVNLPTLNPPTINVPQIRSASFSDPAQAKPPSTNSPSLQIDLKKSGQDSSPMVSCSEKDLKALLEQGDKSKCIELQKELQEPIDP